VAKLISPKTQGKEMPKEMPKLSIPSIPPISSAQTVPTPKQTKPKDQFYEFI